MRRCALVVVLAVSAGALSACGGKLSADETGKALLRNTSATRARCFPVHGYWDYRCALQAPSGNFAVLVRVNGSAIVEQSAP